MRRLLAILILTTGVAGVASAATISGSVYSDEGVTVLSNKTVGVSVNGGAVSLTDDTDTGGQYTIDLGATTKGDVLSLFLDGETEDAITVTIGSGSSMSGVHLYKDRLIVRNETGGVIANAHLATADNAEDSDFRTILRSTSSSTGVVVATGKELLVWTGMTYRPGGYVTTGDLDINGTLTLGSNTGTIAGNWDATGGSFTTSGLVRLSGSGSKTVVSNGSSFQNVDIIGMQQIPDLVGWWKLDEGTGTNAADSSGNGYAGTLTAGPTWSTDVAPLTYADPNPYSVDLDGSNDYISVSSAAALASNPISISFWTKNDEAASTNHGIMGKTNGTSWTQGWGFFYQSSSQLRFFIESYIANVAVATISPQQWNHIVGTWNGTTIQVYVNGTAGTSDTYSSTMTTSNPLEFGRLGSDSFNINGKLDDIRIYNKTLTQSQINSLYNGAGTLSGTYALSDALDVNGNLTISYGSELDVSASDFAVTLGGNWINKTGTGGFIKRGGTVTLDGSNQSVSGTTLFHNLSKTVSSPDTLTFYRLGVQTVSGALTLRGAASNLLSIRSSTNGSAARLRLDAEGSQTIDYLDVKDANASGGAALVCMIATEGCVNSGNNLNWQFADATSITGTVYINEGLQVMGTNKTVSLSVDGGAVGLSDDTDAGGQYSFTTYEASKGSVLTLFLNDEWQDAVTVTIGSGSNMSGVHLYQNRLIVRNETGGIITSAHLDTADNSGDSDIAAIFTTAAGNVVNVGATKELLVWRSPTYGNTRFVPRKYFTAGDVDIDGRLELGTNSGTVAGSWDATGGSFTSSGIVLFASSGSAFIRSNGSSFSGVVVNDGLIGYWTFDETAANTCKGGVNDACDASGFGMDLPAGAGSAAPTITATKPTLFFANARALDFDGSDDVLTTGGDTDTFDVGDTADLTVAGWFSRDTFNTDDTIAAKRNGIGASDTGWIVYVDDADDKLYFEISDGTDEYQLVSTSTFTSDDWHHFAVTWDQDSLTGSTLYIDGSEQGATDTGTIGNIGNTSNSVAFTVGAESDGGNPFDGRLDDLRLYKRPLYATDVSALAAGNQPNTQTARGLLDRLSHYWPFDEGGGTTTADAVGRVTGTLTGNAGWSTTGSLVAPVGFTNPAAIALDGNGDYVALPTFSFHSPTVFTITSWVRSTNTASTKAVWRLGTTALFMQGGFWRIWNGGFTGTQAVVNGAWVHLAIVRDGFTGKLYVNGKLNATIPVATEASGPTRLGCDTSGQCIQGNIDDIRIYERPLSEQELALLAGGAEPSQYVLTDALDVKGDLLLNSGLLDTGSGSVAASVRGSWINNGGGFAPRSGTVSFTGTSGSRRLQSGGQSFKNLTIAGNGTWTLGDALDVNGAFTQSTGTLDTSSDAWPVWAADWDQTSGTFTANASALTLDPVASVTSNFASSLHSVQLETPREPALIGYWKFDEGQGIYAADSTSLSNTGTLMNGAGWTSSGLPSGPTFRNAAALNLDGVDDYVTMSEIGTGSNVFAYNPGNFSDLTIAGWFYRDTFATDDTIVAKRQGLAGSQSGWLVYVDDSDDKLYFEISDGVDEYQLASASTFTTTGWHHFAVVWDQDSAAGSEMYIDGTDDNATDTGTIANIGNATNAWTFQIGAESDNGNPFDGKLDDLRLYGSALSLSGVLALARGTYADGDGRPFGYLDTDPDLVGYWKFDEGTGTNANDSSINNYDGTLTNMEAGDWDASLKPTLDYVNGYSLDFDGTTESVSLGTTPTNLQNLPLRADFSACAWIRPDTQGENTQGKILGNNNNSTTGWDLGFYSPQGTNVLRLHVGSVNWRSQTNALTMSVWQHVCSVYSNATKKAKLYVNATETSYTVNDTLSTYSSDAALAFHIGADSAATVNFDGRIDEVRVYSRALRLNEVQALAAGGGGTGSIVTANTAIDASGNMLLQSGILDVSSSNYAVSLDGNWANYAGTGSFVKRQGTVSLTGGTQTVSGSTVFYNFTKTVTSAATLFFDRTSLQTVSGALTLRGAASNLLSIRSTQSGSAARLILDTDGGSQTIDYLNVQDNNATGGATLVCLTATEGCVDGGNTTNWTFTSGGGGANNFFRLLFFD